MTNTEIMANAGILFKTEMTNEQYQERLDLIRQMIQPYGRKHPKRVTRNEKADYFSQIVTEILRTARKGGMDYATREEIILELLRYEPQLKVDYLSDPGMWRVSMAA